MTHPSGDLVIYGAWYFGQVVREAAEAAGWIVLGYVDPDPPEDIATLDAYPSDAFAIVAIGDNALRQQVCNRLKAAGRQLAVVVHPAASVSPSAILGEGSYVAEQVAVRTKVRIGAGVVLQAGCVVSHDCRVADFASFGPNATAASKVTIGFRTMVGAAGVIAPSLRIDDDCTVAAGAAVFKDSESGKTMLGNPARSVSSPAKEVVQSNWDESDVW
jgi:sugar O-acyltransferase (sialic acid O-acetyltransferase NeuD family)